MRFRDGDRRADVDTCVEVGFEEGRREVAVRVKRNDLPLVVPAGVVEDVDGRLGVGVVCVEGGLAEGRRARGLSALGECKLWGSHRAGSQSNAHLHTSSSARAYRSHSRPPCPRRNADQLTQISTHPACGWGQ